MKQETAGTLCTDGLLSWAEATGFEPAISALTGQRVRPLHYASSPVEWNDAMPVRRCQGFPKTISSTDLYRFHSPDLRSSSCLRITRSR